MSNWAPYRIRIASATAALASLNLAIGVSMAAKTKKILIPFHLHSTITPSAA